MTSFLVMNDEENYDLLMFIEKKVSSSEGFTFLFCCLLRIFESFDLFSFGDKSVI